MGTKTLGLWEFKSSAVAEFFGVSARQVTNWRRIGCPQIRHGVFDLRTVHSWWIENVAVSKAEETDQTLIRARQEYWAARAGREKLRLEQEKGELIGLPEVVDAWAARVREVTSGLSMLSERLPPLVVGKERNEIREIIRNEIWHLRDQYARKGRYCPPPPEPEEKGEER